MTRPLKVVYEGAWYYVMNRGVNFVLAGHGYVDSVLSQFCQYRIDSIACTNSLLM